MSVVVVACLNNLFTWKVYTGDCSRLMINVESFLILMKNFPQQRDEEQAVCILYSVQQQFIPLSLGTDTKCCIACPKLNPFNIRIKNNRRKDEKIQQTSSADMPSKSTENEPNWKRRNWKVIPKRTRSEFFIKIQCAVAQKESFVVLPEIFHIWGSILQKEMLHCQ